MDEDELSWDPESDEMPEECGMCGLPMGRRKFGEPMTPCPRCGDDSHRRLDKRVATGSISTSMRTPPTGGRRKCGIEERHIERVSGETGHRILIHRAIDRRSNIYSERVFDADTGMELRRVEEPLSEHQGRGSAKKRTT